MSFELPKMPEPADEFYGYFTADQLRAFGQEAARLAMELAANVCQDIEDGAHPDGSFSGGLAWECADAIREMLGPDPANQPVDQVGDGR